MGEGSGAAALNEHNAGGAISGDMAQGVSRRAEEGQGDFGGDCLPHQRFRASSAFSESQECFGRMELDRPISVEISSEPAKEHAALKRGRAH
jgi:hypothetical protein